MQSVSRTGNSAVTHWKVPPPTSISPNNTTEAILSNLSFLQRMVDVFEEQGNYAECVRSAESALLLRQANAATVVAALTARQQQQSQKKVNAAAAAALLNARGAATAAAAPRSSHDNVALVALTDSGDVLLPLEISRQAQDVVQRCNGYAVEALQHDQLDSAAFFLNRAMFLTDGDDDDIRDLRRGLPKGESWDPAPGSSDQWWWRRVLQPQQQQPASSMHASTSHKKSDVEDALDLAHEDVNTGASSEAAAATATALRACFSDTPHDQQLRLTLRASTLNHLGCLEQRRGRLGAAVIFFRMAIRTATQWEANAAGSASSDEEVAVAKASVASTYLNLCTVLNATGRHAEAVQACERVVSLLQQTMRETVVTASTTTAAAAVATTASTSRKQKADDGVLEPTSTQDLEQARVATMLVVAYYNLGVSLERQGAADRGNESHDNDDDGPQRAFQQAVQVSQAYHLVPASCRSIEAVMQTLGQPQQRKTADDGRSRQQNPEKVAAAAATVAQSSRPPSQNLSTHPSAHPLPRIGAPLATTTTTSATRRLPRQPASTLPPSPPPPPQSRRAASPTRPASGPVTSCTSNPSSTPLSILRPPSTDTHVSSSNARPGINGSTYPAPTKQSPPLPPPPQQQQQQPPTSFFTTSNAWNSPFAAAPPTPHFPAVLAPLIPPGGGGGAASARTALSTLPPAPPSATFAQPGAAGTNFAATAPPAFTRPSPPPPLPRSDLASAGSGRRAAERSIAAAATMGASSSSANPFGRRVFGSSSMSVSAGRASSPTPGGAMESSARSQRGGGVLSASARGPRNRLAAATSAAAASLNEVERSKRQKIIDRRLQREAAAADAALAEKMYQQLVSEKEKTEVERCRRAAVQIQRIWRGVLARTWVATLIRAAVCLQGAVRHFLVKARAEHARVAAEQLRIRAEESARQEAASRVLQARVRQFLRRLQIRREYRASHARLFYAARTIQRGYRVFCAQRAAQLAAQAEAHRREDEQRRFREKVAARRIQHAYSNYKAKRAELDAYQVQQRRVRSVVRIQAVVRGYMTRAWYAYYRVYRREQEVRSAAMQAKLVVIQSACRSICSAYYGQQRALRALLHMRAVQRDNAATKMQCMWRCHVAVIRRARLQAEHDRDVRHATRIQQWYRMCTQRRAFLVWRAEQRRVRAATRLQRWVRGCWQVAKAREFAAYHAELLRQQQLQRLQARAITVMQACAHACLSSQLVESVRNTYERDDAIGRRWQRVGRGFAARREMALERRAAYEVALKERETARRTAAVRVLQRTWRGAAAKEKVATMRREAAAASVVARAYRVYRARALLAERRASHEQQRADAAARRIQQAVRGFLYGRRAKEMDSYYRAEHLKKMRRLRRAEAAVMIQSQWRGYVTRRAVQEDRAIWQALSAAATAIQRAWKSRIARQQLHKLLAERIIERNQDSRAALTLQCFWRKELAARRVAHVRQETRRRLAAVSVLQSWWRMQMAQHEFARVRRRRREEAALEVYYAIQWEKHATLVNAILRQRYSQEVALHQHRHYLISQLSEEKRRRFLSRHEAATKIQALFRGHYERYYVRGLRAQVREEQRRAAELLARQQRAATTIQCAYRSAQARHALAELKQAEFDRVQASHTDYLESADPSEVVRELFWLNSTYQQREAALQRKKEAAKRRDAAARIQRSYRRHRARRVVATALDFHQQERAARLLQDYWRHHRDIRRIKEHQRRQAAATLLQSHIRGWMVRRSWPLYRSAIEAERQERVLVQDVLDRAAIVLQCFWRRVEAQRTAARRRSQRQAEHDTRARQEAATVIQEAFRRYQRRKKIVLLVI
ncbi:hypothetical protein ABB37_06426 [Leptomonas pyrrhocoris]|uniref:Uncharacterized protein n=1 Tax=Leptomonas pyrrhocoris TaxID=157538 RepID=A0A0M9FY05_LEPPY|nr:hypothetical protein ABB37_06426 [Leptomonas pyrrhocoris]KPA78283.1 hypothetical protein ABB37_06426 [Leptomonas pyrrhocoris]|eukprot:XP_015656722.1 hypothetical protein ABB37_06426 [Leptomonas pyrrhocoris]